MKNFSTPKDKKQVTREAIIGLGEGSIRKSYYPELQEKMASLEKSHSRNRTLMMAIPDMLLVSDARGHLAPFSAGSRQETNRSLAILREPGITDMLREKVMKCLETQEMQQEVFELKGEGTSITYEARMHATELEEVLIIVRDITEQRQLENRLRTLAEKDHLTGLYNRRKFEEKLLELEGKDLKGIALILFDIDGLKVINDTLGHLAGDQIIVSLAKLLQQLVKDTHYLARIGGNEFAVLVEQEPIESIETMLQTFRERLEAYNREIETGSLGVSYGYAYHQQGCLATKELHQQADHHLYQHKLLKESSSKSALVRTLMKALEAKDYITEGHADRMTFLAEAMGEQLGLSQSQKDSLRLLTKFHDLGKVGIPDSILKKPGKLNAEEWAVMKTHSRIGERIAAASPELKEISQLILKHHEKWDGSGYPLQLKGEVIPIECRILAIVDAFDAMNNDRPYRNAMPAEAALAEIKRSSGTQFDPQMVMVFETVLQRNHSDASLWQMCKDEAGR
ncbi:sensor domain-containing diguanylate cyclase/phosphohydrolase [Anoxynatronum buryatiense]|uniref:Diguanylate cyclase (GGDEF) domain-containing protein n=1 Tax=Anoxynatronum buryatiense TaxID=489973 RepID=A0AA46AK19_9CLOT|nr:diguanylate cyclase [Anoxynatronum buryatiense]SMP66757.1 diguanylate cyclase (GGDEF) domain-containing protein [Anoxynatronum buryatiense]